MIYEVVKLNGYLSDTKDAASRLVEAIFFEEDVRFRAQAKLNSLLAELENMSRTISFLNLNPELDDDGLATSIYWGAYDLSPKADKLELEVAADQARILDREFSACVLSGALLQIAKQGISLVYKSLDNCPDGRLVGSVPLKNVIWAARNQSMHFEEGSLRRKEDNATFAQLEADFGPSFAMTLGKSLGYEVVRQLGWSNYTQYEQDMMSLLNRSEQ